MPCLVGVVLWEFQRRVLDLGFRRQGYCGTFEGHCSPHAFRPFVLSCVPFLRRKISFLPFALLLGGFGYRRCKIGEILSSSNLVVKRPGDGVSPMHWDHLIGQIASREYLPDEKIDQ